MFILNMALLSMTLTSIARGSYGPRHNDQYHDKIGCFIARISVRLVVVQATTVLRQHETSEEVA